MSLIRICDRCGKELLYEAAPGKISLSGNGSKGIGTDHEKEMDLCYGCIVPLENVLAAFFESKSIPKIKGMKKAKTPFEHEWYVEPEDEKKVGK